MLSHKIKGCARAHGAARMLGLALAGLACGAAIQSASGQCPALTAGAPINANAATDSGNDKTPRITLAGTAWLSVWASTDPLGGAADSRGSILYARSTRIGSAWSAPAVLHRPTAADAPYARDETPDIAADGFVAVVTVWASKGTLAGTLGVDGDILISRSTDGGQTWSPARAIDPRATTDANNAFDDHPRIVTNGRAWICAWRSRRGLGGALGADGDILVSTSTDAGLTWSAPVPLNAGAMTDSANASDDFVDLATDGRGQWIAVWAARAAHAGALGQDFDILTARSSDDGLTWSAYGNGEAAELSRRRRKTSRSAPTHAAGFGNCDATGGADL